ncbi:unnamed protein product [Scytosiphon promiscuus]
MPEAGLTRRASRGKGHGSSENLERDLPKTHAYPFASQLEAWRESARARSSGKMDKSVEDEPKPLLRGGSLSDGTGSFNVKNKGRHPGDSDSDNDSSGGRDADDRDVPGVAANAERGVYRTDAPNEDHHQEGEWTRRAWNSGSLLVRPGSEPPSGRVPRTTYIYLVGTAKSEDGVEVEVIVGADEERTVMSGATGVTSACVPAREVFTVRNLTKGGKTVVLFWTSPSREVDQHAGDRSRGGREGNAKEAAKRKKPRASERRSQASRKSAAPASAGPERFAPSRRHEMN